METSSKLCMGCMNELDENGVCQYCSYTDDIPHLQSYLAPRTVLDDRYIVGKMLSYNGEGASYICYDMIRKSKAVIREYMPDTLCDRDRSTQRLIPNPDCLAKYKTYMSEFTDMNKVLSRMRNLSHISTPLDIFVENNTTYVILEYVEGVSLKKFLQTNTGYLTWNRVKKLFMPLFTTLSIIHNSGIIHRGISPENIIVTTDGELKLTGFSISSIRTSNTGLSPEFYSGYTAPEQYTSLAYQGTWTDVYAVAAVIYRILTGCMPLDANTRLTNDTLVPASRINPGIPNYVSNVLSHAMAVKGEDRIQTINDFVTQLFDRHYQLEHQKGATQTIPIQRINEAAEQNYSQKKKAPQKSSAGSVAVIVAVIVIIVFLGVGAYMLYQLLLPPDKSQGGNTSSGMNNSVFIADSATDVIPYEPVITTATQASQEDESPYGTGAFMPNVIGVRYETVVSQLGKSFTIRADYFYSDATEKGIVTEQSIPENTEYDPDRKNELVLKVCKGTENVAVPDYSGKKYTDYSALLDSLDIKYKKVDVYSDSVSIGYVVSTDIGVGYNVNVKNGEVLTVRVSKGKTVKTTKKEDKKEETTKPS
ncbi:serine/threonine protein kinase [Ruminococcaceae bacterium FB2012]|nr:serine/threonine protein kinase [Ruminococcaceae bacterium FB2012]